MKIRHVIYQYQHPGNPAKYAIMKWATKMKPNKWSKWNIQQFKYHWLKYYTTTILPLMRIALITLMICVLIFMHMLVT